MWSEELDKKMQQAAEENAHSYTDKEWDKMEALLDKHLPQKKKRRRFFILLFSLLALGIGTYSLYILNEKKAENTTNAKNLIIASSQTETNAKSPSFIQKNIASSEKNSTDNKPTGNNQNPETAEPGNKLVNKNVVKEIKEKDALTVTVNNQFNKKTNSRKSLSPVKNVISKRDRAKNIPAAQNDVTIKDTDNNSISEKTSDNTNVIPAMNTATGADTSSIVVVKKDSVSENITPTEPVNKQNKGESNSKTFSFTFSAGPDISSVGIDKPGKLKMQFGAGISYALSKRFNIRTGLYVSRKVYSADSADYHPPKNFWTYYPNLQNIAANCLVYEIPVTVVYNFKGTKKQHWFVSTGLSSLLMKKETYGYTYKNAYGQPDYYSRTYKNENAHFFSVLHLSGGYQYNFTDRFSIIAEPYLKLPLSGIGFGRIKLNSGGLLLTAAFHPFVKKK